MVRFLLLLWAAAVLHARTLLLSWLLVGCAGAPPEAAPQMQDTGGAGGEGELTSVRLGVPAGPDGLDFAPLEDGAELRLKTFGQGGTHVLLGVHTVGFGSRAFVGFSLTNETTGIEIVAPPPVRPQLFFCDDNGVCDLVPVTVMTGGLTGPDEERDGLHVLLAVTVENQDGVTGSDTSQVVLSTADL